MDGHEPEPCCFDTWADHHVRRARKKTTASGITATLLDALDGSGLDGRAVLDVGCGVGDLAIEAVRRGAGRAAGVELSAESVARARELARERGVGDRTSFEVGDGATTDLPPADVVVLNRVVCCYPDVEGLLDNTLAAAGSVYAFTAPPSRGLAGLVAKTQVAISNAWYRLRDRKFQGFRTFVHDVDRIDERVRAAGFRTVRRERRRLAWELAVYER
ncbi:MAG TPA: class I SAM-dependent methyltransferase [Actinomycetota bacterium]|jgi:magnesium-protoporphyrin O-methyltransferase|nr:class I SAM-dependent methyltransferase [Actinomycetota bacterium]